MCDRPEGGASEGWKEKPSEEVGWRGVERWWLGPELVLGERSGVWEANGFGSEWKGPLKGAVVAALGGSPLEKGSGLGP